mgnify:CR=1 FL=1
MVPWFEYFYNKKRDLVCSISIKEYFRGKIN